MPPRPWHEAQGAMPRIGSPANTSRSIGLPARNGTGDEPGEGEIVRSRRRERRVEGRCILHVMLRHGLRDRVHDAPATMAGPEIDQLLDHRLGPHSRQARNPVLATDPLRPVARAAGVGQGGAPSGVAGARRGDRLRSPPHRRCVVRRRQRRSRDRARQADGGADRVPQAHPCFPVSKRKQDEAE